MSKKGGRENPIYCCSTTRTNECDQPGMNDEMLRAEMLAQFDVLLPAVRRRHEEQAAALSDDLGRQLIKLRQELDRIRRSFQRGWAAEAEVEDEAAEVLKQIQVIEAQQSEQRSKADAKLADLIDEYTDSLRDDEKLALLLELAVARIEVRDKRATIVPQALPRRVLPTG